MEAPSQTLPADPAPGMPPARPWVRDLLLITLGLKALFLSLGVLAAEVRMDGDYRDLQKALWLWHKWDSIHYFDIAANGYGPPGKSTTLVLPPLLPLLIHIGAKFTGSLMFGGLLVATLISFLPAVMLFQLARCDLGDEDAFRAALVLLLFPTGFFLHIVYTEGLFLTTVMGAFLSARQGRWKRVAWFGLLAGLTRINAFVLAPALLVEAWGPSAAGRGVRVLSSLSVGVGISVYLLINQVVGGSPFAFVGVQDVSFHRSFAWPWEGAAYAFQRAERGGMDSMMNGFLQLIFGPVLVFFCVVAARTQRLSYAIWVIGNTLVFTAQGFWMSMPRLVLVLFPAFIWLAPRTAHPVFGILWFTGSVLFLSFFAGQFAQGWWVS